MGDLVNIVPTGMMQRRADIKRHLDKLTQFLASDIPETERAIGLKRYETLCREALAAGIAVIP
jgi:hypothetical protein